MRYKLPHDCQIPNLDKIYYKYFGEISTGFFVEVGAFDGESVSNTSFLADSGWKGIYIEPILDYYIQCSNRHQKNNVIVSNLSVGLPLSSNASHNDSLYLKNSFSSSKYFLLRIDDVPSKPSNLASVYCFLFI